MLQRNGTPPIGLYWRSSVWFTTIVVGVGIATDLLIYTIVIPVLPFQLQELGYSGVSGLVGWLLFAYSGGLVLFTVPIAMVSERYGARRWPLLIGQLILVGSQIMMMEAPNYWVMCLARVIQGIASSIVYVLGLALLCDCTPPSVVGRQLGFAMMGLSAGSILGPPVGGALYQRFGFRGPFVFGMGCCVVDLIGRVVIIERKEALRWGVDPAAEVLSELGNVEAGRDEDKVPPPRSSGSEVAAHAASTASLGQPRRFTAMQVLGKLGHSPRAIVAVAVTFLWGISYSAQESAMPLHLEDVWGLNSSQVGLIYLAGVIPTLISSPIAGWFTDRNGAEWAVSFMLLLEFPWWAVLTIESHLAIFIVAFCFESFFISGVTAPLTAELATVSRDLEGVGYAHVYGAFNLAYGTGSALMYDHVRKGWLGVCMLALGISVISLMVTSCFTGERPLGVRLVRALRARRQEKEPEANEMAAA
ncbi:major facilitator superfamily domain-containing protein [Schizophyllum fasciatum]